MWPFTSNPVQKLVTFVQKLPRYPEPEDAGSPKFRQQFLGLHVEDQLAIMDQLASTAGASASVMLLLDRANSLCRGLLLDSVSTSDVDTAYREVLRTCERLNEDPGSNQMYENWGYALLVGGETERALEVLRGSQRIDVDSLRQRFASTEELQAMGRVSWAMRTEANCAGYRTSAAQRRFGVLQDEARRFM